MMKRSLLMIGLPLAAVMALGTWNQRRLNTLQHTFSEVMAEASRAGVSTSSSSRPTRSALRDKEDSEVQRAIAACRAAAVTTGSELDEKVRGIAEKLSTNRLRELVLAISQDATLTPAQRSKIVGFLMEYAAYKAPEMVVELAMTHPEILTKDTNYSVVSSLEGIAEVDLERALGLAVKLTQASPQLFGSWGNLGDEVAKLPPQRVFGWFLEIGQIPNSWTLDPYFASAKTPEQQAEKVAALRQYLTKLETAAQKKEVLSGALHSFGEAAAASGFESAKAALDLPDLRAEEMQDFLRGCFNGDTRGELGSWITRAMEKFPNEEEKMNTTGVFYNWASSDYQSSGKWLSSLPAGPLRDSFVKSYILGVMRVDPEVATQWALTLPPGKDRENSLHHIEKANKEK
jgi:hypothetical protein